MNPNVIREESLFADALAQPEAQRDEFLERACADDPHLQQRVRELLAAHAAAVSLTPSRRAPFAFPDEKPNERIGRYKLLQKIGEGGCGTVWMAEQAEPVRRRVALKVIKLGMDTREIIARFSAERQALAIMDHPGIAKVFDAGSTVLGRPYFVMELVRGEPITRFCDEHRLPFAQRLDLFIQVCHAVQHAHQKGIIHRDLKPSNILVGFDGGVACPKVIDFGIAKAMQGPLAGMTVFTSVDHFIGTPAYMSPEQADPGGLDIDTRSDVYSLGVLLYELLAGRCPFDPSSLGGSNQNEIRRLIREVDPPRPSTRISTLSGADREVVARRRGVNPARLPAALSGDLDWIVMKALEKSRARRYESPTTLAEDIGRHLRNEPVVARPPGGTYRFRKFVRRNRLAVTAGSAMALTLLVATAVSIDQAVRARQAQHTATAERARVLDERARADDLLAFMLEDLKAPLAKIGDLRVLDRVMAKAMAYFASLDARNLEDRTLVKHVNALYLIGGLRMDTARYPEAEQAYRDAYTRAAVLVARNPRDPLMLSARGDAEWGNGFVRYRQGLLPAAREWFAREAATRAELVALDPTNPRWQLEFAKQPHNLAVLEMAEHPAEARRLFQQELAALEKHLPAAPDKPEVWRTIATVNALLGMLAEDAGEYADAEQRYLEATKHLESIASATPGDTHWKYKTGDSYSNQAGICAITGRPLEAQRYLARGAELLKPLLETDGTNQRWRKAMVLIDLKQAQLAAASGDLAQAGELARKVRREVETVAEKEPSDVGAQVRLSTVLRTEAAIQHAAGVPGAAATAARAIQAADQLAGRPGATHLHAAERAAAGVVAGRIALAQGDAGAARTHWQRAQAAITPVESKTRDWRILDPAARLARLLGEKERAAALQAQLAGLGYVPLEPWP